MHFAIDSQKNQVSFREGDVFKFTRRWEARLLALLLETSAVSQFLGVAGIQQSLQSHGQQQPLNRTQLKRLFSSLADYLAAVPGQPMQVVADPRKNTVGPWRLVFKTAVTFVIDNAPAKSWSHPMLLLAPCIDTLHQLVTNLLISDAFAVHGDYRHAIASLQPTYAHALTAEGRCLLWLREAMWQKRLGHFDMARELTQRVLDTPTPADPGLQTHAAFFLQRIAYDEAPVGDEHRLWEAVADLPPLLSADWRTQAEWHNLRALLARRRLHAQHKKVSQTPSEDGTEFLDQLARRHLESAIYLGAWQRDWDRLQAYVANFAFHLQSVYGMGLSHSPTVQQIFGWHRLTLAYGEKLEAAKDSAWEYIFLGGFWLDNHAELTAHKVSDPLAQEVDGHSPANEVFYTHAIAQLNRCADIRQIAIGWTLYLRFAQHHMRGQPQRTTLSKATAALASLLTGQPKALVEGLQDEGYSAYWPDNLLDAITLPRNSAL
jgi:hypothetical protein